MDCTKQNKGCCKAEVGRGCTFCNCTSEPEATLNDGCFKLHETPWLEGYPDNAPSDLFEVRFKNTRRGFYQNVNNLPFKRGDVVAVEASPGHDIGIISLTGDLVAKQMRRTGFNPLNGEFKKIYRKAKPFDIERWQEAIDLEHEAMIHARQIAADMGLNMKIGDVEYQGDKIKAIFYYIADERVDFRELIKVFAERFHIRIEMKQIGARQEAGRIGGLGACGRELCCASWISSFTSVTTGAARMQDISLNPQKLAGQCSKLKCCMMYEYDTYVDARKSLPRLREPLQTLDGEYFLVKSDALAGTMLFSSSKESLSNMVTLPISRVKEIMSLNRAGKKVDQLQHADAVREEVDEPTYRAEEDSITRFDQAKQRNPRRGRGGEDRDSNTGRTSGEPRTNNGQPKEQTTQSTSEPRQGEERRGREQRDNRRRDSRNRPPRAEGTENSAAPLPETGDKESENRENGKPNEQRRENNRNRGANRNRGENERNNRREGENRRNDGQQGEPKEGENHQNNGQQSNQKEGGNRRNNNRNNRTEGENQRNDGQQGEPKEGENRQDNGQQSDQKEGGNRRNNNRNNRTEGENRRNDNRNNRPEGENQRNDGQQGERKEGENRQNNGQQSDQKEGGNHRNDNRNNRPEGENRRNDNRNNRPEGENRRNDNRNGGGNRRNNGQQGERKEGENRRNDNRNNRTEGENQRNDGQQGERKEEGNRPEGGVKTE